MKRILFIDRDGILIKESPPTYQIDSWDKLEFYPEVFNGLPKDPLMIKKGSLVNLKK